MALWQEFVGGFYRALSPVIAADTAVNVYTDTRQVPGSAKQVTMYGTPGLKYLTTLPTKGSRGAFTQDGRSWRVNGSVLYERVSATAYQAIGPVGNDGKPVSFASNGRGGDQLAICSANSIYVLDLDTNTLSTPTLPFVGAVMITFIDGYGLANQVDSPIVWFSGLEDFDSWDALDFFTRSGTSDNVVGIAVSRDRVWCLGSKTSTLFYNSGDTDTPFVPYPGTAIQTGLASPALIGLYADQLFFVSTSAKGQYRVSMATDAQPQPISTPPIERFLSSCSTLDDAEQLIYEQDGHLFFAITCPSSSEDLKTACYDHREQLWHFRAGWNPTLGQYTQWRARGGTSIDGVIEVGDYQTGDVYALDLLTFQDNGVMIRRERTAPYLAADNQWLFLDQFELGMQAGVGLSTGQGSAPLVNLEVSRDGARTWANAGTATLGPQGEYGARAIWRRLGRARSDRLALRVTQSDPVQCVWGPGAWLRTTTGTGAL